MEELYNYNLDDNDIRHILKINNDIFTLTRKEVNERINILKCLECKENTIKHIIITNPYFLTNNIVDTINLIKLFKELNINMNDAFNINPFILNNNIYDVEEYILKCKSKKIDNKKIIEELINNPYVVNRN